MGAGAGPLGLGSGWRVDGVPAVLLLRGVLGALGEAADCGASEGLLRPLTFVDGVGLAGGAADRTCPGAVMGLLRSVERLMISFPWTTRLSLDFFKSRVIISKAAPVHQNRPPG